MVRKSEETAKNDLYNWVEEGRSIPVLGDGANTYQFVHADDLAEASIRAAARPGFAIYNIGAERFGTMRQTHDVENCPVFA